jgi:hypothetical protein
MEYVKPIVATVAPAIGGNVLGAMEPGLHVADQFSIIPVLQGIAYVVSIAIGLFQLHKYMKDKHPLDSVKRSVLWIYRRYGAPSSPIWRAVGDFAIAAIPMLEAMNFSNPAWEDKRLLVHSILIGIKFVTNLSIKRDAGRRTV